MQKKYSRFIAVFGYLAIIFIVLSFLFNLTFRVPYNYTKIVKGSVDLTDYDFEASYTCVSGEAEFYFDRLLTPEELKDAAPDSYSFNPMAKSSKYVTARIRITVPNGKYMVWGSSPEYASRIYINGELMGTFGNLDETDEKNNKYQIASFEYAVNVENGLIELVTHSAGIIRDDPSYYGYAVGGYELAKYNIACWHISNLVTLGIFLTCGLFFLGYFFIMPSIRTNLWFALLSLMLGVLSAVSKTKDVFTLFPQLGYRLDFFVATGGLTIISTFFVLFVRSMFGKIIPKWFVIASCAVNAAMITLFLCVPVKMAVSFINYNLYVIIATVLISTVCIATRIKRLNEEKIISFAGQILFLIGGLSDILAAQFHIQMFPNNWYDTDKGMQIFIFAQVMALILHNSKAFENERQLTLEKSSLEKSNQMKTEFLGNMSHDMKTPLTVISNISQLTSLHTSDEYVRNKMNTAITEIERMKIMVGQLLELAKIEDDTAGWNFDRTNLRAIISNTVVKYFQSLDEHDNKLTVELPRNLPDVKADSAHIIRVLVNLIHNATRFTHSGKITVGAIYEEGRDVVTVFVADTGMGLSPEQIKCIFDRYYTSGKSTGTGLGLYICKKIVDAHGGVITAQSEPGQGTKISFTLPVYQKRRDF